MKEKNASSSPLLGAVSLAAAHTQDESVPPAQTLSPSERLWSPFRLANPAGPVKPKRRLRLGPSPVEFRDIKDQRMSGVLREGGARLTTGDSARDLPSVTVGPRTQRSRTLKS